MFEGLPRIIRLSGFAVRIEIRDEIKADGRIVFGQYTQEDMTIELRREQSCPAFAVDTLLHELGHAIFTDRDLTKTDEEERIVGQLSRGYTQIFKDNPRVLKWITKSLG